MRQEPGAAQELTRSVAATGDDARARLQEAPDRPAVVRKLRGDTAAVSVAALDTKDDRAGAVDAMRTAHEEVRGQSGRD
jgi:hypothetical protein